jgi:CheY-like chemotaxis protein
MAELLLESSLNPEQRDFAETIQRSGEALITIINDILDFSKIEAGKLTIEPLAFDLRITLEEVADLLAQRAEAKGIALAIRYQPDLRTRFVADAGRIRQIVVNLADNAIKFTDRGHVLIDVAAVGTTGARTVVRIVVEDTGIGLDADVQARLFQKFSQADASTTRKYGGTGLGLAISRQLAELMGGSVGVVSAPGQGSRFWVELPLSPDPSPPPQPATTSTLRGVRALIVDDTAVNLRIVHEQLTHWAMRPTAADSAEEGLRELEEAAAAGDPFQIAIVDYLMPGMDGEAFGRAVRARPNLQSVRLIVTTSSGQRGEAARFHQAGFDGYFVRPVRQATLERALRVALAGTPGSQLLITRHSLVESAQSTPTDSIDQPVAEMASRPIRVLLVEDNPVNQKVATRILEKLGCGVDLAVNGAEAVTMTSESCYDLILMDCQMPELDGYEATAAIRQRAAGSGRHTPIVAMTANAMVGDREKCLAAGMDDYLPKPIRPAELVAKVTEWARRTTERVDGAPSLRLAAQRSPNLLGKGVDTEGLGQKPNPLREPTPLGDDRLRVP